MAKRKQFIADGVLAIVLASLAFIFFIWQADNTAKIGRLAAHLPLFRPWIIATAVLTAVAGISALLLRQKKQLAVSVFALCALLGIQMLSWGYQSISEFRSSRIMSEAIQTYIAQSGKDNVEIYDVDRYDQSLPFYLGRTIKLVAFTGELEFGIKQEPQKWMTEADFLPLWLNSKQAISVLHRSTYDRWKQQQIPMHTVYETTSHIAVARQ